MKRLIVLILGLSVIFPSIADSQLPKETEYHTTKKNKIIGFACLTGVASIALLNRKPLYELGKKVYSFGKRSLQNKFVQAGIGIYLSYKAWWHLRPEKKNRIYQKRVDIRDLVKGSEEKLYQTRDT